MFGVKEYRRKLVTTDSPEELFAILDEIAVKFKGHQF
jgi:hypothetical protein